MRPSPPRPADRPPPPRGGRRRSSREAKQPVEPCCPLRPCQPWSRARAARARDARRGAAPRGRERRLRQNCFSTTRQPARDRFRSKSFAVLSGGGRRPSGGSRAGHNPRRVAMAPTRTMDDTAGRAPARRASGVAAAARERRPARSPLAPRPHDPCWVRRPASTLARFLVGRATAPTPARRARVPSKSTTTGVRRTFPPSRTRPWRLC